MKGPNTKNAFAAADDLVEQVRETGESLALSSPDPEVVLLLIPGDYNQVKDVLGLPQTVPTQPAKAPRQLFNETVQHLQELEHKRYEIPGVLRALSNRAD